jgi:hypothetical protein
MQTYAWWVLSNQFWPLYFHFHKQCVHMPATVCVCMCVCARVHTHMHIYVHICIHIQTVATHTKSITRKSVLNINLYSSSMVDDKACCCCCYVSQETSMQTKYFQYPTKRKKTSGPIICQGIFAILFHNLGEGGGCSSIKFMSLGLWIRHSKQMNSEQKARCMICGVINCMYLHENLNHIFMIQ